MTGQASRDQLAVRVIPCLDVADGRVVKGVNFVDLRDAGDPVALAGVYDREGADELVFLDITASSDGRETMIEMVEQVAEQVSIPFAVGGGLRSVDDARRMLRAGADKIAFNTAAVRRPELLAEAADAVGSQSVVVAIDARRDADRGDAELTWHVTTHGGRTATGLDAIDWCVRAVDAGAGEILLTSMDRDGTGEGFDVELLTAVRAAVGVPVIASGGAGSPQHCAQAVRAGASAVLAASIFHFGTMRIADVKAHLAAEGISVRPIGDRT